MNLEQEYDRRVAAIHGFGQPAARSPDGLVTDVSDIRSAEFDALFDVFLGPDYDAVKRTGVEELQAQLHEQQVLLFQRQQTGELGTAECAGLSNALIENTFRRCTEIFGEEDFQKLFGASQPELAGLIDRTAFSNTLFGEDDFEEWSESEDILNELVDGL